MLEENFKSIILLPLVNYEDIHIVDDTNNNYLAQICSECCYPIGSKTTKMNYQTDIFEHTYQVKESLKEGFDLFDEHMLAHIDKKSFIIYKTQRDNCCNAKIGDITICVAYTYPEYRNNGYMYKLLNYIQVLHKDQTLVIDTYSDELKSLMKKLNIKSFK